jgi:Zn-dependent protease with chaperone function
MGHEIAHAVAQHGNERMSQQLALQMGGIALSEALKTQKQETIDLAMLAFGVGAQVGVLIPYSRTHESEQGSLFLYQHPFRQIAYSLRNRFGRQYIL